MAMFHVKHLVSLGDGAVILADGVVVALVSQHFQQNACGNRKSHDHHHQGDAEAADGHLQVAQLLLGAKLTAATGFLFCGRHGGTDGNIGSTVRSDRESLHIGQTVGTEDFLIFNFPATFHAMHMQHLHPHNNSIVQQFFLSVKRKKKKRYR